MAMPSGAVHPISGGSGQARWWQRGARTQAIGPSRGGQTTKVHLLADVLGRPVVVHLTPGNAGDVRTAPQVLAAVPGRLKRLIADRGYASHALRAHIRGLGARPAIPPQPHGESACSHSMACREWVYVNRRRVEPLWARLKEWHAVATRYEKTATSFIGALCLAATLDWLKP